MRSLASILRRHATEIPDAIGIVHVASGTEASYRDLYQTSIRLVGVLASLGVGKRDKVAFVVRNHWVIVPLLVACRARGAVLVPVDPELHRDEFAFIVDDAAPVLTIYADGASPVGGNRKSSIKSLSELLAMISASPSSAELADPIGDDVLLMIYTSGTTGTNKCVMLTERNLVANAAALVARYAVTAADRFLCILPTHHMNAIMMTGMVPLLAGARIYLADILSFKTTKTIWKDIAARGITVCSLVPSIMALLLKLFPDGPNAPLSALRFGFCGAAPLPESIWRQFEAVFGVPIHQGYGLTETTCWAVSTLPGEPRRYDSVGVPLDGCEVVIDTSQIMEIETFLFAQNSLSAPDEHQAAERYVSGEILIRGPIVGPGYFKNQKLTKESITAERFFRTGDLGFFDSDGQLHISGRLKEIIIKNGANVFSADIDRVLAEHPSVEAAKTIGLRDELVGERICCAFVVKDGHALPELELRAWVQARLSRHLWPDVMVPLGYLPRGAAGKISTNLLRKIISGDLADEIVTSLNSWRYKRAQPSDVEAIRATIQQALTLGSPISLIAYWGCGTRETLADVDRQALDRLKQYADGVRRTPAAPPQVTLICTDSHARNNRIADQRIEQYFASVAAYAEQLGMSVVRMSELSMAAGLTGAQLDEELARPEAEAAWHAHPLRERLIEQAAKHVELGAQPEPAARYYQAMCAAEGRVIAERYPHSIFVTYNHPDFDQVSPPLPKVYLYSYKEGTSVKPWFWDESARVSPGNDGPPGRGDVA